MSAKLSFREAFLKERESLILQIREEQVTRLAEVPEEALTWLALVPTWTLDLAKACDFPTGGTDVAETFRQIKEAGYCDSSTPALTFDDADAEFPSSLELQSFWMPNSMRTEILQRIIHDTNRGLPYLQQAIKLISEKLRQAEAFGAPLPDSMQRWMILASMAQNTSELADWLNRKTDQLLSNNEPGKLLHWIEGARPLEELIGKELTTSLGRAARRLELHHRLEEDKSRLTKFLRRHEQVKAFEDLIEDPSGGWALHYIGSGGMGKTMLIRYLTAHLAPQLGAATARIDFDYLNPDYPAHAPGILLAQLAEELRVHDHTGTAAHSFASFIEKVSNLHERLSASSSGTQFSLATVMAPIYDTLPLFVEALNQLPKPIIIILDTCEELAKIRVDGTIPPSVQATFDILERLHALQPDIRVVFGGRRPLASAGAGWTHPGSQLLPRTYLRAHEIRGFTLEEANEYLTQVEKVPSAAVMPMINHSLIRKGGGQRLEWKGQAQQTAEVNRYHPFDLSLYAAWIHEDPDLSLNTIKSADADRYIDMRIVRRLRHPVLRDLLPAVALLGRFDFNTLRTIASAGEMTFNTLFNELSDQEWINRQSSNFLEVDQGIQPRLLSYYQRTKPGETEKFRRDIVAYLEKVTIDDARSQLDVSHFRVAFRLLRPEPRRAAEWWDKVENRFADEEAYDWLRNICEVILGDEEDERVLNDLSAKGDLQETDLRAAVRASYAAALTHIGPFDRLEATWAEVLLYAGRHPIPAAAARLTQRAQAGHIAAAARYNPQGPDEEQVELLWQKLGQLKRKDLDSQMTGSFIAAVEAILEFLESGGRKSLPHPAALIHFSTILSEPDGYQEAACFASALTGRLLALSRDWDAADEWFHRSMLLPLKAATRKPLRPKAKAKPVMETAAEVVNIDLAGPQTWLDWRAPDQLGARIRLEFIRSMYPVYSAADILRLIGDNVSEPATIDTDRLGSAILRLRAANGLLLTKESEDLAWKSRYSIQHEPLCHAHRSFPPLFAAVAEAMAAEGKVDEAIGRLTLQSAASESVEQFATVMEADRACLRISRRMRLRDEDIAASTSVHSSVEFQDVALLWAIEGLSNPKIDAPLGIEPLLERATTEERRFALLHARFRTTYALRPEMANSFIGWSYQAMEFVGRPTTESTFAELSCFLDCVEANEISRQQEWPSPFPQLRLGQLKSTKIWQDKRQSPPLERLTLLLRHAALDASRSVMLQLDRALVETIGYRQAARIALDEGELLALRVPVRAVRLLDQAYRWFVKANDYIAANTALICKALALIHSGQNASLSRTLNRLEKDYGYCQTKILPDLPTWETLTLLAENPQAKSLDRLSPSGWRPWLIRLIAGLAWQKDAYRSATRSKLLARWIATNYGVTAGPATTLPAELDGWLTAETPISPPKHINSFLAITLAKKSTVWQSLESVTEIFLALRGEEKQPRARVRAMGLAPYRRAAQDLLDQLDQADSQLKPEVLGSLASHDVITLNVDHPSSWLCWEGIVGLALQEVGPTKDDPVRVQRTVRDSKKRRMVTWNKVTEVMAWTNDLHTAEVARDGWMPISNFGNLRISDSESINFGNYNTKAQVLHVIGTPTETSAGVRLDLSSARSWHQESRGIKGGVTGGGGSGYSGGGHGGSGSGDVYPSSRGAGGGSSSSRGDLIKAETLFSLLPNMALCILQAVPRAAGVQARRTQSDREQAAYLRLMGAELSRLGVPVVITIPSLVLEIAPAVINKIAESFFYFQGKPTEDPFLLRTWSSKALASGRRWSTKQAVPAFLGALTEIQALIKESSTMPEEDVAETALDVCLYAADVKV